MKRLIYISLFYFILFLNGISQTYFSKRLDVSGKVNGTLSFCHIQDTFYIPSLVLESNPVGASACLMKISSSGSIIAQKRFKQPNKNYEGYTDILNLNKKLYVPGITQFGTSQEAGVYSFNTSCDSIYIKSYFGDTSYTNRGLQIQPYLRAKNKLVLIGLTDSTCGVQSNKYRPFVRVVDTNGILYQTKLFMSTSVYRNLTWADTTLKKGYIITGVENGQNYILKLDSNLNFDWLQYVGPTTSRIVNGLTTLKNGKHMLAHSRLDSTFGSSFWEKLTLTKLDTNGSVIWQKFVGSKKYELGATAVKELKNKDLIICGSEYITRAPGVFQLMGFLIRTDSLGNLKWWRNYVPTLPVKDTVAECYLFDVLQMPDGGFAASGFVFGTTTFSTIEQSWLLRVDSMGCLSPGCAPVNGIEEIYLSSPNDLAIKTYPNPFGSTLNVEYKLANAQEKAVIIITEIASGKLVDLYEIKENNGVATFDTRDLNAGVFLITISQKNLPPKNIKIVNTK